MSPDDIPPDRSDSEGGECDVTPAEALRQCSDALADIVLNGVGGIVGLALYRRARDTLAAARAALAGAQTQAQCGVSWDGYNVTGDAESIAAVRAAVEMAAAWRQWQKDQSGAQPQGPARGPVWSPHSPNLWRTAVVQPPEPAREPAALAAQAQVCAALSGIDRTEDEAPDGWWPTSVGASFGAKKLAAVKALLGAAREPSDEEIADVRASIDALRGVALQWSASSGHVYLPETDDWPRVDLNCRAAVNRTWAVKLARYIAACSPGRVRRLCDAAQEAAALRQRAEAAEADARLWRLVADYPHHGGLAGALRAYGRMAHHGQSQVIADRLDAALAAEQQPEESGNG